MAKAPDPAIPKTPPADPEAAVAQRHPSRRAAPAETARAIPAGEGPVTDLVELRRVLDPEDRHERCLLRAIDRFRVSRSARRGAELMAALENIPESVIEDIRQRLGATGSPGDLLH